MWIDPNFSQTISQVEAFVKQLIRQIYVRFYMVTWSKITFAYLKEEASLHLHIAITLINRGEQETQGSMEHTFELRSSNMDF